MLARLEVWARALRLHQWAKNLLLFVPLAAAHRLDDRAALLAVLLGFIAFGLVASATYVVNDLLDLESDRLHPTKRERPFASGQLAPRVGWIGAPLLLAAGFALGHFGVAPGFAAMLGVYLIVTLAYSLRLKRLVMIDTFTLAALYTLRLMAGAIAAGVPLSFWMLTFSALVFLSLAMLKRHAELVLWRRQDRADVPGRGYVADDALFVATLGMAAGLSSVLVLALYLNSPEVRALYASPLALGLLCPLVLYWISHMWLKAHRGQMHDDPLVFALRDPASTVVGVLAALVVWAAR